MVYQVTAFSNKWKWTFHRLVGNNLTTLQNCCWLLYDSFMIVVSILWTANHLCELCSSQTAIDVMVCWGLTWDALLDMSRVDMGCSRVMSWVQIRAACSGTLVWHPQFLSWLSVDRIMCFVQSSTASGLPKWSRQKLFVR